MSGTILHLALASEWEQATAEGSYGTSTLGVSIEEEGYLHACEDRAQLDGVAQRYYADVDAPLVVLSISEEAVAAAGLMVGRERPAPGADLFPHVYGGRLPVSTVVDVSPFERGVAGV
ncbi:DUF952 domain-containing protein [Janibacter sp. Y6]|uniref:DUF952 domain-containing protein n=1 Tax=Janibacter sp. Y6 TaxID=2913552 RepID=UPI0034A4529E